MSTPWNPKSNPYEAITSDYFDPVQHPSVIDINLKIEVYQITYDWGLMAGSELQEYVPPYYVGTLEGQVTSANFTVDSTSDMRTSGSFSIILDEGSKFLIHANDYLYWQHVWFKVIKQYKYLNNGGLEDECVVGWFVPNDGSYTYNSETREFSLSCTDMLSFYTDTRGGHLSEFMESCSGLLYEMPSTADPESEDFKNDVKWVFNRAYGMVIEGEKNRRLQDKQYDNYLASQTDDSVSTIWKQNYDMYKKDNEGSSKENKQNFSDEPSKAYFDTASLIRRIVGDYGQIIPLASLYIRLQNDTEMLPYDLEFNGDTTLYDVLKKIVDLYPRQCIYFDTNRQLNLVQNALSWGEAWDIVESKAREFSAITLEEHWNVDLSNIKNFTVIFGRDECCNSYYYLTDFQAVCEECGKLYEYPVMPEGEENRICKKCGGKLQRVYVSNSSYSVSQIGTHKQVINEDNVLKEEEAFNTAKALTIENCRAKKTLSVTFPDRYFNMYARPDIGVGTRIEYTSKTTRETDVYTILKWSNSFTDRTVTLELEPYYPCVDEHAVFVSENSDKYSCRILPTPEFTYSIDESGLLTMVIHNGWHTKYSMFKIYCTKTDIPFGENMDFWSWSMSMNFIGETCEVYTEETDTEHETKVFRYQFKENGRYLLTCQAWNPNIHPSSCPNMEVINVNVSKFENKYVTSDNEYLIDENNDCYVS